MKSGSVQPIHLLIADDHPLIRSGMRAQLEPLGGPARFRVSEAHDAASLRSQLAQSVASEQTVELALVDVMMPGMQGAASVQVIAQAFPQVAFVVVTALPVAQVAPALRGQANIRGLLDKSHSASELRRVIDLALAGQPVWPVDSSTSDFSALTTNLIATSVDSMPAGDSNRLKSQSLQTLSQRQQEVALAVSRGLSNAQIAAELGLTEGTVKAYLKDIFKQVGVSSRTQLALRLRSGETDKT